MTKLSNKVRRDAYIFAADHGVVPEILLGKIEYDIRWHSQSWRYIYILWSFILELELLISEHCIRYQITGRLTIDMEKISNRVRYRAAVFATIYNISQNELIEEIERRVAADAWRCHVYYLIDVTIERVRFFTILRKENGCWECEE